MSELIYYVGPFSFPNGGAAARRIYGNIKTLREIGYEVKVIDGQPVVGKSNYDGIDVVSVGERPPQNISWCKKVFQYLHIGKNTVDYIKSGEVKPRFIVLYSGYSPYLFRLLSFCKRNKIKLIFDCVEWYQPKSRIEYIYNPYYWNIELAMRFLIPKCDGVICISEYLKNYYNKRGCSTVVIPPTLSIDTLPPSRNEFNCGKIKLVYTGNPGHKDSIAEIISVVSQLKDKYELNIAGVVGDCLDNVKFHGLLEHEDAIKLVSQSHFSILFRPINKTSSAGFSTKVVESMSCGTPVITNNTGDLSKYIFDDVNGYIFDGDNPKSLKDNLERISATFNIKKYNVLSAASFDTANKSFFDKSDLTVSSLGDFLSSC
ncbi:glycosyltransferase [Aeromonas caviae]